MIIIIINTKLVCKNDIFILNTCKLFTDRPVFHYGMTLKSYSDDHNIISMSSRLNKNIFLIYILTAKKFVNFYNFYELFFTLSNSSLSKIL